MHKRYPAVVVCCAALAAAGCGSSNTRTNEQATTAGRVSEGVFITDVNGLCQAARTASGGNLSKASLALSQALPQFKAINPPATHQVAYSKFLAHLEALAAAVKNRNAGAAHAEAGKLSAVAKQLGLSECQL